MDNSFKENSEMTVLMEKVCIHAKMGWESKDNGILIN